MEMLLTAFMNWEGVKAQIIVGGEPVLIDLLKFHSCKTVTLPSAERRTRGNPWIRIVAAASICISCYRFCLYTWSLNNYYTKSSASKPRLGPKTHATWNHSFMRGCKTGPRGAAVEQHENIFIERRLKLSSEREVVKNN